MLRRAGQPARDQPAPNQRSTEAAAVHAEAAAVHAERGAEDADEADAARAEAPNTTATRIRFDDVNRADDPPDPTVDGDNEDSMIGSNAPVFCKQCEMWLNGQTQWWDHVIGKKHEKFAHRARQTTATPKPAGWGAAEPEDEPDAEF